MGITWLSFGAELPQIWFSLGLESTGSPSLDAILAAVNLRVRFDAAQTLTVAEQLQARTNIGAVAAADVGNTDTDFVAVFEGALA